MTLHDHPPTPLVSVLPSLSFAAETLVNDPLLKDNLNTYTPEPPPAAEVPLVPGAPAAPDEPDVPVPDVPEEPAIPLVPGAPAPPFVPEIPDEPDVPPPDVPEEPAAPAKPCKFDCDGLKLPVVPQTTLNIVTAN
jgi:hypothetical protein